MTSYQFTSQQAWIMKQEAMTHRPHAVASSTLQPINYSPFRCLEHNVPIIRFTGGTAYDYLAMTWPAEALSGFATMSTHVA